MLGKRKACIYIKWPFERPVEKYTVTGQENLLSDLVVECPDRAHAPLAPHMFLVPIDARNLTA